MRGAQGISRSGGGVLVGASYVCAGLKALVGVWLGKVMGR
jgi:hypothetical protein